MIRLIVLVSLKLCNILALLNVIYFNLFLMLLNMAKWVWLAQMDWANLSLHCVAYDRVARLLPYYLPYLSPFWRPVLIVYFLMLVLQLLPIGNYILIMQTILNWSVRMSLSCLRCMQSCNDVYVCLVYNVKVLNVKCYLSINLLLLISLVVYLALPPR